MAIFAIFSARRVQHVSGHTMCGSMADIQSATAEIRPGKKERRRKKKKKPQGKNIMVCPIPSGDRK